MRISLLFLSQKSINSNIKIKNYSSISFNLKIINYIEKFINYNHIKILFNVHLLFLE
jgi:hypothetical protein